jgi:hypothetical protein
MATIVKELHDGLVTVLDKLNTMVAVLQRIGTEQQDCIYKLEVMAGIQLADAKPPLTPLPSLLLTPSLASTNLVQSPLETMDAMLTLHPDLQRIGDEQQPMPMDGLPVLHPDLQQISDSSMPCRRWRRNLQFNRRCCFHRHRLSLHRRAPPPPAELNPDRRLPL